ncbi:MAG: hypothetical protein IT454_18110 [Planctomycetes bacterium]|nr:hypothetical protein [Planctomycetota bacterium]
MIRSSVLAVLALVSCALAQERIGPQERPPSAGPKAIDLDAPVARWDDGAPLANGVLGALVWGDANVLRISLDRADLWDERLPETLRKPEWTYATMKRLVAEGRERELHELFDVPYDTVAYPTKLPGGRVELTFGAKQLAKRIRLDPTRGEVTAGYGGSRVRVVVLAHLDLVLVRVDADSPSLELVPPAGVAQLGYEPARVGSEGSSRWFVQKAADGLSYAVVATSYPDSKGVTFAITVGAARGGADPLPAARTLTLIDPTLGYDGIAKNFHYGFWSEHWKASWVKLPDASIQAQYDLARYVYGAGSRVDRLNDGGAPLPLQGLWTADEGGLPPWKGDYHNDLNTQTTYIAYGPMGYADAGLCFLRYLEGLTPSFARFAKSFYGVDGLVAPGVMTLAGQATGGWGQYSLSPTNTAWLAHLFEQHWRLTGERAFLESSAYPWCSNAGEALLALLAPNDAGKLRLPLSTSPEIFDNSMRAWLAPNSNYDQALLVSLFGSLRDMASALGRSAEAERWSAVLGRLEPLDVDPATGALTFARGTPYAESHRHFSHAMAIHPLGLIDVEGPEAERKLVEATLEQIEARGTDWWTGYSFAWFACMQARAAHGDKALGFLEKYLAFTGRNGFHLNGDQSGKGLSKFTYRPFTLEGNMLAAQAVHEMLLQSWGGIVRVFPATSSQWADVQFSSLRAQGGWRVSARREGGVTRWVAIQSDAGGRLVLRDPFAGADPTASKPVAREGRDFVVTLAPGEKLELWHPDERK